MLEFKCLRKIFHHLQAKYFESIKMEQSPQDNPFPNSPIYSYGHRNPQGLAWYDGLMVAPEHGYKRNDEINIIQSGANYGWPIVECTAHEGYTPPLRCFADWTIAPGGATFDDKGNFYVAGLRGAQVRKFILDGNTTIAFS